MFRVLTINEPNRVVCVCVLVHFRERERETEEERKRERNRERVSSAEAGTITIPAAQPLISHSTSHTEDRFSTRLSAAQITREKEK